METHLHSVLITPEAGLGAAGPPGGPFSPASQSLSLTNFSAAPLTWSINSTFSWLNVSVTGGALAGDGQTAVTASLNSLAASLAAGIYSSTLFITNQTTGIVQSRQFVLSIVPLVQNGGFETGDDGSGLTEITTNAYYGNGADQRALAK